MVQEQIQARGVTDRRVLEVMKEVPRHIFVPERLRHAAYEDTPLPIGHGQTISQPYIVALMTELLELTPNDRVLEIGTGSGYQAALLSRLAREVISIERIPALADEAGKHLTEFGADNVRVRTANGSLGVPDLGPFDAIVITAAAPDIPKSLISQLREGGRLVTPVGGPEVQTLIRVRIKDGRPVATMHGGVRFVPLIGVEGWV